MMLFPFSLLFVNRVCAILTYLGEISAYILVNSGSLPSGVKKKKTPCICRFASGFTNHRGVNMIMQSPFGS